MTIDLSETNRGFLIGEFLDAYGAKCSIQESSVVPHIWLGPSDPDPKICVGNGTGWQPYQLPENVHCTTRMHLNQRQAAALIQLLQRFVDTGSLQPTEEPCPSTP